MRYQQPNHVEPPIDINSPDVALVVSFSGGKDSAATLAMIGEHYPLAKTYVVMADTGWEHSDAYEWAEGIVQMLGHDELPLVQGNYQDGSPKSFVNLVRNRHSKRPDAPPWPSASCRQCTSDLKRDPIHKWIKNNVSEPIVVNIMGIRAEESRTRKRMKPWSVNDRLSTKRRKDGSRKRLAYDWYPIHQWTTDEVFGYLAEHNIPVHPVYQHLPRFSCRVCILMGSREIRQVYQYDREAFDRIADLEDEVGYTMRQGESLRETCADLIQLDINAAA